ncbi:TlpA family protein disulfide reductase [Chitinophaga varians]|uniref:TlpA family protein disulfide reductase n=1 Tax=Chitinophaga varians TaxID=2202339 RepID=UPI00165F0336|nr:TlpA disulfide reductase family protein [Chitinophaga varians]MBC9913377.1 TlpA family protein disulfide reductase [Chitinophaga varians]
MGRFSFSVSNIIYTLLLGALLAILFIPGGRVWFLQQLMKTGLFQPAVPKTDADAWPAPEILFRDAAGAPVALSSLKGKVVFINFWATWCPPCRAEMPSVDRLYRQWKDNAGIVFLIVDADSEPEKAAAFMRDNGYQLPVAFLAGNVPQNVYSGTLPTTLIIDKAGRIVFRETGVADYGSRRMEQYIQQLLAEKQ